MELILTQRTKSFMILALGIPISALLLWGLLTVFSQHDDETTLKTVFASFGLVKLLWFIAYVWFVAAGFKIHTGWGIVILVFPPAAVFFTFIYPKGARRPMLVYLSGWALLIAIWACHQDSMTLQLPQHITWKHL